ncbi:periplasmic protein [Planctomycetes bacterium Pan216]|uniref:Periplasmic protein n=1 Tax=Kolteria novifilia TaxID=2527975 RepID=A0A518BBA4_9BACT|nr:periplasmic protein [Planctomycetes bacterium Pan216]
MTTMTATCLAATLAVSAGSAWQPVTAPVQQPAVSPASTTWVSTSAPVATSPTLQRSVSRKQSWLPRIFKRGERRGGDQAEQATGANDRPSLFGRRQPEPPSDHLLVSRCRGLLRQDRELATSSIHVTSNEGVLTLQGHVITETQKSRAERLAQSTPGITRLDSHLVVRSRSTSSVPWAPARLSTPTNSPGIYRSAGTLRSTGTVRLSAPTIASTSANQPDSSNDRYERIGPTERISGKVGSPMVATYLLRRIPPATTEPAPKPAAQLRLPATLMAQARPTSPPRSPQSTSEWGWNERDPHANHRRPEVLQSGSWGGVQRAQNWLAPAAAGPHTDPRIDAFLASDPRAGNIRYELEKGILTLSGSVPTAEDLYALADDLRRLPGVEIVSFQQLAFER